LDIGDDGKTLFVSSRSDDKLVALDTTTGTQRTLTLSPEPYHLDKIPGTGKVYVSSSKAPMIWVVDQKTFTVTDTIQLPAGGGHQIAVIR
jgi:outer membrane protein assembly factor BamB